MYLGKHLDDISGSHIWLTYYSSDSYNDSNITCLTHTYDSHIWLTHITHIYITHPYTHMCEWVLWLTHMAHTYHSHTHITHTHVPLTHVPLTHTYHSHTRTTHTHISLTHTWLTHMSHTCNLCICREAQWDSTTMFLQDGILNGQTMCIAVTMTGGDGLTPKQGRYTCLWQEEKECACVHLYVVSAYMHVYL